MVVESEEVVEVDVESSEGVFVDSAAVEGGSDRALAGIDPIENMKNIIKRKAREFKLEYEAKKRAIQSTEQEQLLDWQRQFERKARDLERRERELVQREKSNRQVRISS